MNRDKVLELAREAGLERIVGVYKDGSRMVEVPQIELVERFAALIEREVRGDAEPVVIIHSVRECGGVQGSLRKGANAAEVIGKPLYTHPTHAVVQPQGWLHAIDEAMVCSHLGVANEFDTYEDAKKKLNTLICWHVDVAIDPTVNGGRKLYPDAVVRHLLVALRMVLDDQDALDGRPRTYEYVKKALAAAKEAGL